MYNRIITQTHYLIEKETERIKLMEQDQTPTVKFELQLVENAIYNYREILVSMCRAAYWEVNSK